jgi:hypothetical protein
VVSRNGTASRIRGSTKETTAIAAAMIAHTPAASPSTPSEKLTTFIISTSPTTVRIGPAFVTPALGKWSFPTNGRVIAFTATP